MNRWLSDCNRLKGERDEERKEDEGEADQVAVSSALPPLPGNDHFPPGLMAPLRAAAHAGQTLRDRKPSLICWEFASEEVRISPEPGKALLLPAAAWRAGRFGVADQSTLLQQVALTRGILGNVVAFRRLRLAFRSTGRG